MSTLSNARRPLATAHRLIHDGDAKAFRGYLHSLYETDRFGLEEAGELLYEYTCKNGTDFVKSLPETASPDAEGLSLVQFLSEHFFPRFSLTADNRRLLQRVYLLHKNLAVDTYEALRTRASGDIAYDVCCRYADVQDGRTPVGRLSVITARTRAVELMESMAAQFPDRTVHIKLANAYRSLSTVHRSEGDLNGSRQAQKYSRKALDLCRQLYSETPDRETAALFAGAQEDMADLLQGSIMHKQAEAMYRKALELRREDEAAPLPYALCCGKLASLHAETRGSGRREQAVSLYETEAELLKALSADTDPDLQREFALCRMALGDLYAESQKVKDIITAFDHYKAASALHMRRLTAEETDAAAMEYAQCRYRMALTLWRVGGDNNLNTALHIPEELNELQKRYPTLSTLESRLTFLTYALEDRLWIRHPLERSHPEFHPMYEEAYGKAEILEILGYLPASYREQMSCRELTELRLDALPFYKKHIDPRVPLNRQKLSPMAADWVTDFMKRVK
ncbi:MAG: hypothetical protein IJD81_02665 [Oscillospiraceae bacterium]|nr:hypothetical protein [Oscillospiraceae bacterium]